MKKIARRIIAALSVVLLVGCSAPDSATKTFSLHAKLTVRIGEERLIGGNTEYAGYFLYHGKKDTIATVGYAKRYPKYRNGEYNPRDYEDGLQYVDATPGSIFYLRGIGTAFEIISCDEKTIVIRIQ